MEFKAKKIIPLIRAWGPYTAHMGIMLIIVGYCLSYGLGTEDSVTLQEGERKLAGDFILELEDIIMTNSGTEVKIIAEIELIEKNDGGIVIDDEISKSVETIANQETVDIYLKHELHRDLYITLNKATPGIEGEPSTATITVREIPGIILVWIGSFLTILGMLMTMFTEWKNGRKILKKLAG